MFEQYLIIVLALVAFVGLVMLGYFSWEYCRAPRNQSSRKVRLTKVDLIKIPHVKGVELNQAPETPSHVKLDRDIIEKVAGGYRYTEYMNRRKHFLLEQGIVTTGTIVSSKYDSNVDRDPGYIVVIRFVSENGVEHLVEVSSWLHWPTNERWNEYVEQRKVGREVTVYYRPDLDDVPKDRIRRFEDYLVDFGDGSLI